jgi:hypothetical protein
MEKGPILSLFSNKSVIKWQAGYHFPMLRSGHSEKLQLWSENSNDIFIFPYYNPILVYH